MKATSSSQLVVSVLQAYCDLYYLATLLQRCLFTLSDWYYRYKTRISISDCSLIRSKLTPKLKLTTEVARTGVSLPIELSHYYNAQGMIAASRCS
jgi:hypothetical protein